ncbi:MAG: NAD-dependent deacylase [Acidobacteria bacterium]|nr:NAD-dependent deacylase [Acidobacteriota bacterium]
MVSSKLKSLLIPLTRVVVFTGAGISAESGVPTFRGQNGLWNEFRVEDLATPQAFAAHPQQVWEWYSWRRELISKITPNQGHSAVAHFERFFSSFCLVSQNVDGLHDRAGNQRILKLHGDIWEVRCISCGLRRMDFRPVLSPLPPRCECGGMLRPGVVWFGEMLPSDVFERAVRETQSCDLFFSVGTSAEVFPAAQLPGIARQHGAYVVEVNIERSAAAHVAHEVLLGKAGEILPELSACLQGALAGPGSELAG